MAAALSAMNNSIQRYGLTDTVWGANEASIDVCPTSIRSSRPDLGWPMRYTPYASEAVLPTWLLEPPRHRPRICVTMGTAAPALKHLKPLDIIIDALSTSEIDVIILDTKDAIQKPLTGQHPRGRAGYRSMRYCRPAPRSSTTAAPAYDGHSPPWRP